MKNENLIHVKLEYGEALQSKRDVLSSEMNLLRIAKTIKNYHILRAEELKTKSKLHRRLRETITNVKKAQITLPKLKNLEILKKGEEIKEPKKVQVKEKKYDDYLESELQEIQEKLKSIGK